MRKISSYASILILLCTAHLLTPFARQDSDIFRTKDFFTFSQQIAKANMETRHDSEHVRKLKVAAEEISLTGKGQKGKGAYGGANVVHRQPDKNAAPSTMFYSTCFFILSATILGFSFFS